MCLVHSSDVPFEIKCEIETCDKAFSAFSAFSSHVYRYHRLAMGLETVGIQHPDEYGSNVQMQDQGQNISEDMAEQDSESINDSRPAHMRTGDTPLDLQLEQKKKTARFLLNLMECH